MTESLPSAGLASPAQRRRLGRNIRKLRTERALSQQVLAVQAGLGLATLSRIELGKHEARQETLEALARELQVEVADLIGRAS